MKAWLMDGPGGIEKLRPGEVEDPHPTAGEVVVAVAYAALNPADRYLAEGQYPAQPALPHILGRDGLGTIVQMAPDVQDLHVGDRVIVLRSDIGVNRPGTFAERVAGSADAFVPAPAGWTDEQAAGATLVYLTAYQALTQWGDLPPSVVLISGASGGVGIAAIQLAGAMGHTPIALSRSVEKRQSLQKIGAAAAFDPNDPDWPKKVKDFLAPRRVDLVVENIGGALFGRIIETLADHGRISVVGRLAGPVPQFNTATLLFRRLRIGGVAVGAYTPAESHAAWSRIVQLMEESDLRPLVDHVYPFDQLPAAFGRLAEGPLGKVLIKGAGAA